MKIGYARVSRVEQNLERLASERMECGPHRRSVPLLHQSENSHLHAAQHSCCRRVGSPDLADHEPTETRTSNLRAIGPPASGRRFNLI